jgi:hypothetical protein
LLCFPESQNNVSHRVCQIDVGRLRDDPIRRWRTTSKQSGDK